MKGVAPFIKANVVALFRLLLSSFRWYLYSLSSHNYKAMSVATRRSASPPGPAAAARRRGRILAWLLVLLLLWVILVFDLERQRRRTSREPVTSGTDASAAGAAAVVHNPLALTSASAEEHKPQRRFLVFFSGHQVRRYMHAPLPRHCPSCLTTWGRRAIHAHCPPASRAVAPLLCPPAPMPDSDLPPARPRTAGEQRPRRHAGSAPGCVHSRV